MTPLPVRPGPARRATAESTAESAATWPISEDVRRWPVAAGPHPPRIAVPRSSTLLSAASVAVLAAATILWARSLDQVDVTRMTAVGLVSVLPIEALVAVGVVTLSFCAALGRSRVDARILAAHVVVLVVMLYGVTALVEPASRFETALHHVGIADYIAQTGHLNTSIDAYFSWPGFFVVLAFVSRVAGLHDGLGFVPWAPLFFNLLYLGPLLVILRSLTRQERTVWLAVWVFYVANWSGQDYLSPQATAYFLYLVVVAILLRWFTPPLTRASRGQRAGLMAVVILASAAIVPSHQLTPFALLAGVTALVLFARCTAQTLPVLIAVLISAWLAFMTVAYLSGHLAQLTSEVGHLGGAVAASVGDRIGGSAGHRVVVDARLALTGAVWALAAIGWVVCRRAGRPVRAPTVLALAPFPLIAVQSYGGEILIRISLFALPFAAFLAAAGLLTLLRPASLRANVAIAATLLALLGGFLFARYGNEKMDAFSPGDVAGVRALYRMAPRGSQLLAASESLPWKYRDYDNYTYGEVVKGLKARRGRPRGSRILAGEVRDVMLAKAPRKSFLIITRSQIAQDELLGATIVPVARLERTLRRSVLFRVAYANRDATIFVLSRRGRRGT